MPRLPRLRGRELIAALRRAGFGVLRIKGSHHFLEHPDSRRTFIDWPADSSTDFCVELSFFPDEIQTAAFSVRAFDVQIEAWRSMLGSQDFFVRQENASWDIYDAGGLGVIYTHSRPPLWQ